MAEAAYQQDLPPFYVTAYHLSKVGGSFSLHTSCWLGKKNTTLKQRKQPSSMQKQQHPDPKKATLKPTEPSLN